MQNRPPAALPLTSPTGSNEFPAEPVGPLHDGYGSRTELTDKDYFQSETDDEGSFRVTASKSTRRRKRECSGSSTATEPPAYGSIIVFLPTDTSVNTISFKQLKWTASLEANCLEGVDCHPAELSAVFLRGCQSQQ